MRPTVTKEAFWSGRHRELSRETGSRDGGRSSTIQLSAAGERLCPWVSDELQRQQV